MSGRRQEEEEVEETTVYLEHAEEEEAGEEGKMDTVEDDKKSEYTNLPKLDEAEPEWASFTQDNLREWLRVHNVKGTWAKNLLQKCKDVWDDMQAIIREKHGGVIDDGAAQTEEPDFANWSIERKRAYLRRRDVKGIWSKYVDAKCVEIFHMEKSGEKYVHTPPSLGRTKIRFPGQSVIPMGAGGSGAHTIAGDVAPMTVSSHEFHELATAAQSNNIKRLTELLNHWSQKNMLPPEEAHSTPAAHMEPIAGASMAVISPDGEVHMFSDFSADGRIRTHKAKRTSTGGTPGAKRKKTANGTAAPVEEDPSALQEQIALLQSRLREVEAENQHLRSKTPRK